MNEIEIKEIVQKERDYFFSGEILRIEKRIEILKKIKENLFKYQEEIKEAFILDFNKCAVDYPAPGRRTCACSRTPRSWSS